MVKGILAFFGGGALAGALLGLVSSLAYGDPSYLFMPIVFALSLVGAGFIPFACFAALFRNLWSTRQLQSVGFIAGFLHHPILFGLDKLLTMAGYGLGAFDGPLKPVVYLVASSLVIAAVGCPGWGVIVVLEYKAARSEA